MERLVDYIVVLELDESQIRHGSSVGTIKQRFPETDWEDVPFSPSLTMFCMPQGWNIAQEAQSAIYFVGTLTDMMGSHQYACCLQLWEPMSSTALESVDDSPIASNTAYKPKVLVILTRFTFFEFFRMSLRRLKASLGEDGDLAENIVLTLLTAQPRRTIPYTISLGQERFMLRATSQSKVPMTGKSVSDLVRYLGSLHNLVLLYRCVVQDQKIVLHSKSMNRLSTASFAVKAIVFPMEYTYPFVPLLPEQLLEYLESPTPFLMGILSEHVQHVDAVFVNLDTGEIRIPSNAEIPNIPNPFLNRLLGRLQSILSPELETSDIAETVALPPVAQSFVLDKRIRACFLLLVSEILYGYRSCLQLVRLRGVPLIVFHRAAFIGLRHLNSQFFHHMLQGQMFQLFVMNRGIPYRECDVFDEIVCRNPQLGAPLESSSVINPLMELSEVLEKNEQHEHYLPSSSAQKETTVIRIFNASEVEKLLKTEMANSDHIKRKISKKLVPSTVIEVVENENNSRRIMVLTACIDAIFDNRLPEARRMLNAVELALRIVEARVFLCRQLSASAVPVTRATLNPQQFELVVRLLNCALEHETEEDEHGIAYACLHLCNLYCRRLTQGVHQYAYTCVQDHPVWANPRFWEAAFFHDVHELMRHTYGSVPAALFALKGNSRFGMWNLNESPTGMEVAADLMQTEHELTDEEKQIFKEEEDAIVYGQAKHYINLMVCLKVPLDPSRLRRVDKADLELRGNTIGKKDLLERMEQSESDNESGYGENCNDGDIGATVVTWISSLIDRLCCAARLNSSKVDRLITDIPGFVAVHVDNLDQVYAESRKIAPPPKTTLLTPVMLTPSEKVISGPLRCVLLVNEKLQTDNPENVRYPLPAEGAVYLTNYRVIFKGQPINPYLNDETIVRSMPVMSLVKEKSISDHHLSNDGYLDLIPSKIANGLHDAIQIRSSCYVLMNLAFDEDVTPMEAEEFMKAVTARRWPETLPQTLFAYAPVAHLLTTTLPANQKSKISTIRDLKKTISKQLPLKGTLLKRMDRPMSPQKALTQPRMNSTIANEADYLDLGGETSTLTREVRHYLQDYERLRLKAENSLFRLSYANTYYDVVKTYPACFIVPCSSSDATFAKVSKGFKNGRLPVITWISENGALLVRGAGIATGNVLNKFKKSNILHHTDSSSTNMGSQLTVNSRDNEIPQSTTHSSSELQEAYVTRLAQASPANGNTMMGGWNSQASSLLSLDSLLTGDGHSQYGNTPDLKRKSTAGDLKSGSTFIRASTGKSGNKAKASASMQSKLLHADKQISQKNLQLILSNIHRKNLYVLVDKGQQKIIKVDKFTAVVPITYPSTGDMKAAFKKHLRTSLPGDLSTESVTFYKQIDESGWILIISQILGLATSISSIITIFNSSVALCIEDGYDITCVLISLVQIMQDSHYRTIEGFQTLIEKEWLAFGYRFSHRANHTLSSQSRGIAPVFLIFLDCVHQILDQYKDTFEFDDYYLRFLAYHSQSGFFRNFIFDSELERVKMEKYAPESFNGYSDCIWAYIKHQSEESTVFNNLQYSKTVIPLVPATSVASFDLWTFFSEEDILHGSCYDIEIAQAELAEMEERRLSITDGLTKGGATPETLDARKFSTVFKAQDRLSYLVQEADKVNPVENKPNRWKKIWSSTIKDEQEVEEQAAEGSLSRTFEKNVAYLMQKRNGLKLILRGEYARASKTQTAPKAHSFEHYSATGSQPHDCNLCHFALYGNVVKRGQRCKWCGIVAHEKCVLNITWPCGLSTEQREKALLEAKTVNEEPSETLRAGIKHTGHDISFSKTLTARNGKPVVLHQGYLRKKGNTFKMWTPRWFVLEANTHLLSYYENETDTTRRGSIDLCELQSVEVILTGSKALLELKTVSKNFSLLADGKAEALAWKDKIEHVLRE